MRTISAGARDGHADADFVGALADREGHDSTNACGGDGEGEKREESRRLAVRRGRRWSPRDIARGIGCGRRADWGRLRRALDYGAGCGHGVALRAGHEGRAVLRILREGKINKIGGSRVQAVLVNVADDADDLRPSFAITDIGQQDALSDGIFIVGPIATGGGLVDEATRGLVG